MAIKESFYYNSDFDDKKIHAVRYIPKCEIRGILQISHGMVEYIERYEDFANYLCEYGFLVVGNDHRGHGCSVESDNDYGYFAEKNGNKAVLEDLRKLTEITEKEYPEVPYFLLGHSMGSFYARQYLCEYGNKLNGAVIMGTGCQPKVLVSLGKALTRVIAVFKGWHYRSSFVNNMAFGGYNKKFEPALTPKDWLTKDKKIVAEYIAEKRCSFIFTLNGYYSMFTGIKKLYNKSFLARMPKNLPVFFMSGKDDPVGDFSLGVEKAVKQFKNAGMKNVRLKIYNNDRHEILNETDRQIVYADILKWLNDCIDK